MEEDNTNTLTEAYRIFIANVPEGTRGQPVVIGGFAVALHGGPRKSTKDLDLAVASDDVYPIEKAIKAMIKAGNTPFSKKKGTGTNPDEWQMKIPDVVDPVKFDWLPVGGDYVDKSLDHTNINEIICASIPDLVLMKAKSLVQRGGRDQDLQDMHFLLETMTNAKDLLPDRLKSNPSSQLFFLEEACKDDPTYEHLMRQVLGLDPYPS